MSGGRPRDQAAADSLPPRAPLTSSIIKSIALVALGVVGTGVGVMLAGRDTAAGTMAPAAESPAPTPKESSAAESFATLAALPPDQLAGVDIARLNLLAAEGLPGAEDLHVDTALAELDRWVEHVRFETDRHLYKFRDAPGEYENSEAYFRMLMLIVAMQADLGVHYNPQRIDEPDFTNSKDLFIHGMIGDNNGGTCVSMPALYVAVGRRLSYPLHLVVTRGHVFARWDDSATGERFNIEGTNRGLNTPDDEHYRNWPYALTEAETNGDWFLRSLTPSEAFALFLMQRGHCLEDTGKLRDAQVAYALAHRLAPKSPEALQYLENVVRADVLAWASDDPDAIASQQRDQDHAEWLQRQREWSETYVQEVLRRQERSNRPTNPGGPSAPSIPGVPGAPSVPGSRP